MLSNLRRTNQRKSLRNRVRTSVLVGAACLLPLLAQAQATPDPAVVAMANDAAQPRAAIVAMHAAEVNLLAIADTGKRLIAVGQHGSIVVADSAGQWHQVPSPVDIMLTRVRFSDAQHGWIVGYDGAILATNDGGDHWTLQHYSGDGQPLYDLLFLDPQHGIAIGANGSYLETSDGGAHWTSRSFPITELSLHLNALTKLADGTLVLAGEKGLMAYSRDQGAQWQMLRSPYTGSFYGAFPVGEHGVLLYGMRGHIYVSDNLVAAATQDPASWQELNRSIVTDPKQLAAMGWRSVQAPTTNSLFGATRLPDQRLLLVGINGIAVLTDPALTSAARIDLSARETLADVTYRNAKVVAVGRRGAQSLGALDEKSVP